MKVYGLELRPLPSTAPNPRKQARRGPGIVVVGMAHHKTLRSMDDDLIRRRVGCEFAAWRDHHIPFIPCAPPDMRISRTFGCEFTMFGSGSGCTVGSRVPDMVARGL